MSTNTLSESAAKKNITKLQRAIVDGLEDVKAQDIQVFNTAELSPLFERVIVASGTSNRQTKALAASVRDAVRAAGFDKPRIEGEDNGEWIIVDCGAAVAHIMQPAIRQYYRLEELWGETPVRLKLGAPKPAKTVKPAKPAAAEDVAAAKKPAKRSKTQAEAPDAAAPVVKKPTVKKPAAKETPARAATKTAVKTAAKAAPKTAVKTAAKTAAKTAVKKAAQKSSKAPVKTIVVAPPARKKAAAKTAAKKTAASQTASRKSAGKKSSSSNA
ncbi:ribosome silencing factor [Extensimonas vulgaris]|uniref:Ribosomal silencing factor RsfS n=1 Tax=Extensimonas vulgaris TaxID=1031594 RepID=A0A369AIV9_9BURK|nr:ribosome silencing factor [Extensimonas vulgaris]RCX08216.1 ribosome-associated protein [Extensimonas vulgaris]TWI37511.1 ribosome-associated protein [Extensimonas vulgaris]TXD13809.1 ribosome silencing factor [Extensimonas vulgaris]